MQRAVKTLTFELNSKSAGPFCCSQQFTSLSVCSLSPVLQIPASCLSLERSRSLLLRDSLASLKVVGPRNETASLWWLRTRATLSLVACAAFFLSSIVHQDRFCPPIRNHSRFKISHLTCSLHRRCTALKILTILPRMRFHALATTLLASSVAAQCG